MILRSLLISSERYSLGTFRSGLLPIRFVHTRRGPEGVLMGIIRVAAADVTTPGVAQVVGDRGPRPGVHPKILALAATDRATRSVMVQDART